MTRQMQVSDEVYEKLKNLQVRRQKMTPMERVSFSDIIIALAGGKRMATVALADLRDAATLLDLAGYKEHATKITQIANEVMGLVI